MSYLKSAPTRRSTPQFQPAAPDQVRNSAGGYVYKVDPLTRLRRFLILGSEGGSYYASERDAAAENVASLGECDPYDAVKLVVDVSRQGLAAKNDPALYALAYYAAHPDPGVRSFALDHLGDVARTGTHLMHFAEFVQAQRGWGRSLRRAVAGWYEREDVGKIAYQAVKYRQRDGWSHRDLLRLAHPQAPTLAHRALYSWIVNGGDSDVYESPGLRILEGFERAQDSGSPAETARLVREYDLPHEAVPTEHKRSREVWDALLERMPAGAMIRNLPTMTRVGLIDPMSDATQTVASRLSDAEYLRRARVHPFQLLVAHLTYAAGRSVRGSSTWQPVPRVIDALDAAFYLAFQAVEPTGKRHLVALDVSGSMGSGAINGVPGLTPYLGAAAMALVTAATEPRHEIVAFTATGHCLRGCRPPWAGYRHHSYATAITPLDVSPRQRLADVVRTMRGLRMGGTDCALPWIYAREAGRQVDVAVTYTDSESWAGETHTTQELDRYRRASGIEARSVVCAMVANKFSVADPNDPGQMDVVGMDASAPRLIADFAAGRL